MPRCCCCSRPRLPPRNGGRILSPPKAAARATTSIVTFTDKAVEMWEVGCSLDKVQKIGGLDVIILDMTCSDGESTDKRRELLLKLEDNKVMRYPQQQVLQRCSELKAKPGQAPEVDPSH